MTLIFSFVKWCVLAIFSALLTVASYPLALFLPLFATPVLGPCDNNHAQRTEPRLPKWLNWFMTPDNSLYGDKGWREEHCVDGWNTYFGMVQWLWKNPTYGFDWTVLAAEIDPHSFLWTSPKSDPQVQNRPVGKEGFCFVLLLNSNDQLYWGLTYVKRFGTSKRCLYINAGWKLKTFAENKDRLNTETKAQFVLPFPRITEFRTA